MVLSSFTTRTFLCYCHPCIEVLSFFTTRTSLCYCHPCIEALSSFTTRLPFSLSLYFHTAQSLLLSLHYSIFYTVSQESVDCSHIIWFFASSCAKMLFEAKLLCPIELSSSDQFDPHRTIFLRNLYKEIDHRRAALNLFKYCNEFM